MKKGLTWEDGLNVPGESEVEGSIQQHHEDAGLQVEGVVGHRAFTNVAPLWAQRLLLVASDVGAAKAKGDVGRQALETGTEEAPVEFGCVERLNTS